MTTIAARSTLPAQTKPLRLMDRGILRSIHDDGTTVHITLDRIVRLDTAARLANRKPATYAYDVPVSTFTANGALKVTDEVYLATDGTTVTSIYRGP